MKDGCGGFSCRTLLMGGREFGWLGFGRWERGGESWRRGVVEL